MVRLKKEGHCLGEQEALSNAKKKRFKVVKSGGLVSSFN